MNLSDLVAFARQTGEDLGFSMPERSPNAIDMPVNHRIGMPAFDAVDRPPFPWWVEQQGGPADGLVLDDDPPSTLPATSGQMELDTIAYYLPYHFYRPGRWGIKVLESGVLGLAQAISGGEWPPSERALQVAWAIAVDHERFHCFAESAVTRGETLLREALYRPYYSDRCITPWEEAMANAYAYRRLKETAGRRYLKEVAKVLKSGGEGYNAFESFVRGRDFGRGESVLAGHAIEHDPRKRAGLPVSGGSRRFLFRPVRTAAISVQLVNDRGWAKAIRRFPKWGGVEVGAHVDDHPPVHFHISIGGSRQFRLTWADLAPTGEPLHPLSGRERKKVNGYLNRYGEGIRKRLSVAYGIDVGPAPG